jgi:predicted DNA-binding protein YlxM (UPF0122 family)
LACAEVDSGSILQKENAVDDLIDKYGLTSSDIYEIVNNLPYTFKITFLLYYHEDYSHQQIANQLSITEKSSRANLAKARKMLRNILNEKLRKKHPEYSLFILLLFPRDEWKAFVNAYERGYIPIYPQPSFTTTFGRLPEKSLYIPRVSVLYIPAFAATVIIGILFFGPLRPPKDDPSAVTPKASPTMLTKTETSRSITVNQRTVEQHASNSINNAGHNEAVVTKNVSLPTHKVDSVKTDTTSIDTVIQHQTVHVRRTIVIKK